ncbi:AAA family ATPase [Pedobacter gandavensis]|uniref:AAA family ATPase n=1 Tax=Pedobacter gandavensis TaxID=2679963 RepID=A0ABR6F080_9SPHI|nr:AAA family ATPase [Pedobacter gandavensis]MBB2150945.1 AAA family ATPase [Pedobacter gandavensis]
MNKQIKKIAIVGPESTGKSTIAQQLAKHYQTLWVPEYARYYCAALTNPCNLQDEVNMYHGQLALEESILAIAEKDLIFCDTTFITVKVWSDEVFGNTPEIVLNALPLHTYDLYLLMDIDLPWQEDPLRDFPHKREHFMQVWHQELQNLTANYVVINGTEERLSNAIAAVASFLKEQ